MREGKGFYNKHSKPQHSAVAFGLPLLEHAVEGVRRRASDNLAVAVFHTDLPTNDFDPLFALLSSPTAICMACPTSSLTRRASPSTSGSSLTLKHRAHELSPGGRLVVMGGASDERGNSGAEGLLDMANAALQEIVDVGALRAGVLELESSSEVVLPDPFWPEYEQSGDAKTFGADYAEFFRAAYGPSLFGALDADRTSQEREKIASDPATAACAWHVALLLIAKRSARN